MTDVTAVRVFPIMAVPEIVTAPLGILFAALIVTLMVSSTSTVPSLAVSVKLSEPLALASGV